MLIILHEKLSFLNYCGHRKVLFVFYDLSVLLVKELEIRRYLVPLPEVCQVLKRQEFVLAMQYSIYVALELHSCGDSGLVCRGPSLRSLSKDDETLKDVLYSQRRLIFCVN